MVLPCGAGKTIVGLSTMSDIQRATLILTPNTVAVRQWINEIIDKTDVPPEMVGEYTGERKDIAPITVSTYQILTYRRPGEEHIVFYENPRDPAMNQAMAEACRQLNERTLIRHGRRLRYSVEPPK